MPDVVFIRVDSETKSALKDLLTLHLISGGPIRTMQDLAHGLLVKGMASESHRLKRYAPKAKAKHKRKGAPPRASTASKSRRKGGAK